MDQLPAIFGRSYGATSILIRVFTGFGPWSHCGVIDGDFVIEAMALKGVVRTPLAEFVARYSRTEIVQYDCPRPDLAIAAARAQIGKPYDWLRFFGVPWRARWDHSGAFICNEFVEFVLRCGGRRRWRKEKKSVSPTETYLVL